MDSTKASADPPHEMPPSDPAFAEKSFNFVVAEVIHHHEQAANGR